jgi:hypothetical protein
MSYATFSHVATPVNLENVGVVNGYKLNSVLHSGRKVPLTRNDYYYIPRHHLVVSYRGTKARPMTPDVNGKYNFQEKLPVRGVVPFKADVHSLHMAAELMFG